MDLQNIKIKILAKANYAIEFIYPKAKACGNSKAGSKFFFNLFDLECGFSPFHKIHTFTNWL